MSELWWKLQSLGSNPFNEFRPFGNPTWVLMSGSTFPCPSDLTQLLVDTNFATEGGIPYATLTEYDPGFPPPIVSGATLRVFDGDVFTDLPTDSQGYSQINLQLLDPLQALFGFTSSLGISKVGSNFGLNPSTFPAQIYFEDAAWGPIVIETAGTGSILIAITKAEMFYGTTRTNLTRTGLYINAVTGSPHLSLEPTAVEPVEILPGDIWMRSGSNSNLMVAESDISGSVFKSHVLTYRDGETTSSIISRLQNGSIANSILVVDSLVTDDWLTTINTSGTQGTGWRNEILGGGIYMPDSGTVAVYSAPGFSHNFVIPSGNLEIHQNLVVRSGSIQIQSGSIDVVSGSVLIPSGGVFVHGLSGSVILNGSASGLFITGSNASAKLRGGSIISVLTGSVAFSSISSGSLVEGTLYINSILDPPQIHLWVNGGWMEFSLTAPSTIDGGLY